MGYTKNIGNNLITQAVKIVFGVLSGILVARALGPSGQGYITYILLIFTTLGAFGHFGIINAAMYFQKRSAYPREILFSTNMNLLLLMSLGLGAFILLFKASALGLADYSYLYIALGIILLASTLINLHHQSWLVGDEKIIKNNRINLQVFLAKSLIILAAWATGLLNPLVFFLITTGSMVVWMAYLHISLHERWLRLISVPVLKAEFSYGSVGWLASLFAFLHYRADQVMIKQMLGLSELGIYTVAVTIAELLFLLPNAINIALTGRLYNLASEADSKVLMSRTLKLTLYFSIALALIGLLGSLLIPLLYGSPYKGAVSVMMILLPGVVFASLAKVAMPWFFTKGRPQVHFRITLFTLLLNVGLNYLFIPRWGIQGAAFASTISYFIYGTYYPIVLVWKEGFSLKSLFYPESVDIKQLIGLVK